MEKLKIFLIDYSIVVFLTILLNIVIRIFEFVYLIQIKYEEVNFDLFFSKSINFDSLFIILFSLFFLAPLLLLYFYSFRLGKVITRILFSFLLVVFLIFSEYFLINNALLSNSLFDFSIGEVFSIVLIELSLNRIEFIVFFIFLMLLAVFVFIKSVNLNRFKNAKFILALYLGLSVVGLLNYQFTFKALRFFDNYNHFLIGNSKPVFFLKSYFDSFEVKSFYSQQEIKEQIVEFQSYYKNNKTFEDLNYPLINRSNYDNVLGPFFNHSKIKPNIVIIVSESLSASFSGNNLAIKGSITPFTDSLANNGLSWDNFFSNAERSYGVLPNLLSSLLTGVGSRGFINMEKDTSSNLRFPQHNSLYNILKKNNYITSYFYGGSGNFDHVGEFMDQNLVDNRITLSRFDTVKYFRYKRKNAEPVWGFNDKDVYSQGIDYMDDNQIKQPYFSVFQTLSNHSPYNLSDDKYYTDEYLILKLKSLGLNFNDVKKIERKILASIFYADDALKHLITELKKRDGFENTIFIITGDHAVDLNLNDDIFENYRVPLVIYSPLLKEAKTFKGVCSHIDVLPSLLSLLNRNYGLDVPLKNHWLGMGLDTNATFVANRFIPLNLNALDMPNAIINNKVLFGKAIYSFDKEFKTTKVSDSLERLNFLKRYNNYKIINKYCCKNNLIWNNLDSLKNTLSQSP